MFTAYEDTTNVYTSAFILGVPNIINMIAYHISIVMEGSSAIHLTPVIDTSTSSHMPVFLSL